MMRANDILKEQEDLRETRMGAMVPVIEQIGIKIRQQAIHSARAPYILYEVPTYVFGYPLFDMKDALEFLVRELSKAGYWVWVVDGSTSGSKCLFISWLKPVKTRDNGKPILTTNYRPMVYDPTTIAFMPRDPTS
jgi:hypothetical protein